MLRYSLPLLLLLTAGCPETTTADCTEDPLQRVCIDACVESANQFACIGVVDACRAQPDTEGCAELIQACMDMPTAIGCSGDGDAAVDASADVPEDAGPCGVCSGETPVCNETTMECVGCVVAEDCGGTTPFCSATGTCIECEGHDDCTNAGEARCGDMGMCEPCGDSAECAGTGENECVDGNCVECTEDTADTHCAEFSCDPALNACTETERGMTTACGACASDTECITDHRCIATTFEGTANGGHCLKTFASGCARPFSSVLSDRASLSGAAEEDYCGIDESTVSCDAVAALQEGRACAGGVEECAADGARCETVGAFADLCTYSCGTPNDCPAAGAASTCGAGYCGS